MTPLAWLTALREKDPVTGNDEANDPNKLQMPSVRSSCVASTESPLAETFNHFNVTTQILCKFQLNEYRGYLLRLHNYTKI
jgi:hypothetical protein